MSHNPISLIMNQWDAEKKRTRLLRIFLISIILCVLSFCYIIVGIHSLVFLVFLGFCLCGISQWIIDSVNTLSLSSWIANNEIGVQSKKINQFYKDYYGKQSKQSKCGLRCPLS